MGLTITGVRHGGRIARGDAGNAGALLHGGSGTDRRVDEGLLGGGMVEGVRRIAFGGLVLDVLENGSVLNQGKLMRARRLEHIEGTEQLRFRDAPG